MKPGNAISIFGLWLAVGLQSGFAADTIKPSVPDGLAESGITVTGFTLSWAASTDNVGVTGYQIYRNGASLGTTAAVTWPVTGLAPNTLYNMTVRARDAAGNWSAQSAPHPVTTLADTTAPSPPGGVAGSAITVTSFTLSWTASTDDVKVTGYEVLKNGVSMGTSAALTRAITALMPDTDYVMTVRARDAAGNWSIPSVVTVRTLVDSVSPSSPPNLGTSVIGVASFTLTWTASTDNVKVTGYEVTKDGVILGTSTALSRAVTALTPNTPYVMTVRARDAANNWSDVSSLTVTTLADVTPPTVPTGLVASSITASSFTLKWTASTDNVKVTAYDVFRGTGSAGTSATTSLSITGLAPATSYTMAVRARDAAGNPSGVSSPLTVTTIKATSVAPTITSAHTSVYGNSYTATATGSAGTGALVWALGTGSTAADAAIDPVTGDVTANSIGKVVIKVQRAGDDSYNPSPFSGNFAINITGRPITLTLSGTKPYDGTTASTGASAAITAGNLAAGDTIDFVYAPTSNAKAGTYLKLETPTVSSATAPLIRTASYIITYAGSYIITKAPQLAPTIMSPSTFIYGSAYTATATGGSGTGKLIWGLGADTTAGAAAINATSGAVTAKSVGVVAINVQRAGDANYDPSPTSADSSISVMPRPITVTLSGSKVYDGTPTPTGAKATRTLGTMVSGDVLSSVFADTSSPDAGSYPGLTTATIANATAPLIRTTSYDITYAGSYTITKATQAAPTITSSHNAVYGTTYTATASGGVGTGDLVWSLGTGSNAAGAAIDPVTGVITANSIGKVYIRVLRAADTNHTASPLSGNFLVTFAVRPITVTRGGSKIFDGTNVSTGATATITVGSLGEGDSAAFAFGPASSAAIGNYPIVTTTTISNAVAPLTRTSNYAITVNGSYAITKIPVTFTLSASSFLFTGAPQGPTVIASPATATFTTGGTLSASAIGSYVATATATGNYTGSNSGLGWAIVSVIGPPLPPADVASTNVTATGFTVNWTPGAANINGYEVFVNGVSQGITTQTSMDITGLNPGTSYTVTVRSRDTGGNWSDPSTPITVMYRGVPFIANFEPAEGYQVGPLEGQNGWVVTGAANVVTTPVYAGTQAVSIPPAATASFSTRGFTGGSPAVIYVDFYAQPAAAATPDAGVFLETDVVQVALTGSGGVGSIQVYLGNGIGGGTWVSTGTGPALDVAGRAATWGRYTVRCDYTARKWDLYFNGQMIKANLGFTSNTPTGLSALSLGGHTALTTGFDELFVAFDNPIFVDADKDGMDDAWETAHGLNPAVNDRDLDPDSDGLTNIEEYIRGTNPTHPDNPANDTDGDGLLDAWEMKYFGTLAYGATDDPGSVGRTLAQSLAQGLSPWPAPAISSGLRAWYRSDLGVVKDGSNKVSQWTDLSGFGLHVVQTASPAAQPTWASAAFNSQPALTFAGSYLNTSASVDLQAGQSDLTVIAVMSPAASQGSSRPVVLGLSYDPNDANSGFGFEQSNGVTNSFRLAWRDGGGAANAAPLIPTLANLVQVVTSVKSGASATSYLNGTLQGSGAVTSTMRTPTARWVVGGQALGANSYAGQLAEVLVYNRALSDPERQQVEAALKAKYVNPNSAGNTAVKLAAGGDQSLWINSAGVARGWGRNVVGQLGDGTAADRFQMMRVVSLPGPMASVAAGESHGLAVTPAGQVYAWGDNEFGQLGDGTRTQRRTPVLVAGLQNVVQVAAGDHHSLALLSDGTVWAWGGNQHGQLGDGSTTSQLQPELISGLTGIVSIVAGANHSAAVDSTGHVWTWGANAFGQLADATVTERDAPAMIAGLTQVVALASGRQHLLALLGDGTVKAWGANEAGQLGLGTTTGQAAPVAIPSLTGIKSLAAGGSHSMALGTNGILWTWGANDTGQLGNGQAVAALAPTILIVSDVTDCAAGRDHVVVLKTDGTLWSWGFNHYGQLGNSGAGPFSTTPVTVSPPQD